MNLAERIKGKFQKLTGAAKMKAADIAETRGSTLKTKQMKVEGEADKVEGTVRERAAEAEDAVGRVKAEASAKAETAAKQAEADAARMREERGR